MFQNRAEQNKKFIRLDDYELDFINKMAKAEKSTRSEIIKRLVNYASSHFKIDQAVNSYKDGKCTIRECAEIAGLRYFEFFDILAKEKLIGTSAENIDLHLDHIERL